MVGQVIVHPPPINQDMGACLDSTEYYLLQGLPVPLVVGTQLHETFTSFSADPNMNTCNTNHDETVRKDYYYLLHHQHLT